MSTNNFSNAETNKLTQTNLQTKAGIEKSVKQTSNKQTQTNPNFYNITTLLAFRINVLAKQKYMELSYQKKKIVKLALESIIYSLAEDKEELERVAKELGLELGKNEIQPVLNININMNENKAEANVKIDLNELLGKINSLESLLFQIQKNNFDPRFNAYRIPQVRFQDVINSLNELKKVVN